MYFFYIIGYVRYNLDSHCLFFRSCLKKYEQERRYVSLLAAGDTIYVRQLACLVVSLLPIGSVGCSPCVGFDILPHNLKSCLFCFSGSNKTKTSFLRGTACMSSRWDIGD